MIVYLISSTENGFNKGNILSHIGNIAGICYGKFDVHYAYDEEKIKQAEKRAISCFKQGHMSVFEHVSFTWYINGISRACSHQLVRHRVASYTQESQRYLKVDIDGDWHVEPAFDNPNSRDLYLSALDNIEDCYLNLLERGEKPENARSILPNCSKTNIVVTMNLREFIHFYNLRTSKGAQEEIKELAESMKKSLIAFSPELSEIL